MPNVKTQAPAAAESVDAVLEIFQLRDEKQAQQPKAAADPAQRPAPKPVLAPVQKPIPKPAPVQPIMSPFRSEEGMLIRRLKFAIILCVALSILSTLVWIAIQTGDMTQRLGAPVVFSCHVISAAAVLVAWLKK